MSNLNWNQVKADFHDANQSMATSVGALSQAGTVFGQLRKSILDEEQRAIDNAYREKEFGEKVRQFGITSELERDKFGETSRHNRATEDYNLKSLEETSRHNKASEANSRAMLGIQSSLRELQFNKYAQEQREAGYDRVVQSMLFGSPEQQMQARSQAAESTDPMVRNLAQSAMNLSFFSNPKDALAASLNLRAMYSGKAAEAAGKMMAEDQAKAISMKEKIDKNAEKTRDSLKSATADANQNDVSIFKGTTDPVLNELWNRAAPNSVARLDTGRIFTRLNSGSKGFFGTMGNWVGNNQFDITSSGMSDSQFEKILSDVASGDAFFGDTTKEQRDSFINLLKQLRKGYIRPDGSVDEEALARRQMFVGPPRPKDYSSYNRELLFGE